MPRRRTRSGRGKSTGPTDLLQWWFALVSQNVLVFNNSRAANVALGGAIDAGRFCAPSAAAHKTGIVAGLWQGLAPAQSTPAGAVCRFEIASGWVAHCAGANVNLASAQAHHSPHLLAHIAADSLPPGADAPTTPAGFQLLPTGELPLALASRWRAGPRSHWTCSATTCTATRPAVRCCANCVTPPHEAFGCTCGWTTSTLPRSANCCTTWPSMPVCSWSGSTRCLFAGARGCGGGWPRPATLQCATVDQRLPWRQTWAHRRLCCQPHWPTSRTPHDRHQPLPRARSQGPARRPA